VIQYWPFRAHVDRREYVAYMRKSWAVQSRDASRAQHRALADLAAALTSRAFLVRFLPLAAIVFGAILLLTAYGVIS
jgi:hypothetical protein